MLDIRSITRTLARLAPAALAVAGLAAGAAQAQDKWPAHSLKIIVAYPPGATGDIMVRAVSTRLSEELGQAVVIENRAGGAGISAADAVAKATPDGYTLLLDGPNHVSNVGMFKRLPYDTAKDFAAVSNLGVTQTVLLAYPGTGFKTADDLVKAAKAAPGKINFGSAGNGTAGHLSMELFARHYGIKMTHVPYKGATPALTDLMGGQVQVLFTGLPPTLANIQAGRAVPLVVSGGKRAPQLPNVPSMNDLVPGYEDAPAWFGLFTTGGTPKNIINDLSKKIDTILKEPAVVTTMNNQAVIIVGGSAESFEELVKKDLQRVPPLIRSLGISTE
ncbi:MAG TPA: tripartite tricarboxylate transporter substrate-binding protein [Burkholderiales bacterium]|jgi:tripartite-type tricarboxylate transporter receptor subunit TctC|nr:tripartite tricarboxylate transporter substrate-binding protein [Burkholderiales bacterium]